jgi:rhodanese-related sulfurtransferase
MRTLLLATLLGCAAGAGCAKPQDRPAADRANLAFPAERANLAFPAERAAAQVPTVTVDELDRMLARHDGQAVDANGQVTRQRLGVIPGAVLLRDPEAPDAIAQLPSDRSTSLVFYCANAACGASHEAASKAILAGYANVKVLPEGIAGWVKAGKQTTSI